MRNSRIVGTGRYIPQQLVTNLDLSRMMNTSDDWIRERTGIVERHYADVGKGETTAFMGAEAAKSALASAGLTKSDVDFIIFATLSPDYYFPGSGCQAQVHLELQGVGAMDVRNQCTGFLYGLATADQFIKTGMYDTILVIGSEVHSVGLDFRTESRDVTVLFGDGAGAAVVTATEAHNRGILASRLHADGDYIRQLWVENPGNATAPLVSHDMIDNHEIRPYMNGKRVFINAVRRFPEVIREVVDAAGLTIGDVDLVVPHQANERITEAVQQRLELPKEKVFRNIQKYGNTTSASIPIALSEAVEEGRIVDGSLVCMAAFGSGFTWAASLIRW